MPSKAVHCGSVLSAEVCCLRPSAGVRSFFGWSSAQDVFARTCRAGMQCMESWALHVSMPHALCFATLHHGVRLGCYTVPTDTVGFWGVAADAQFQGYCGASVYVSWALMYNTYFRIIC